MLGGAGLSGGYGGHFCFFSHSSWKNVQTSESIGWFISNLFSAYLGEHSVVCVVRQKGDLETGAKQYMLSINTGAILFITEVVVNLLFVECEVRGQGLRTRGWGH
jgi:hypothetical protein